MDTLQPRDKIESAKKEIEALSRRLHNFNKSRVKASASFDMSKYIGRLDLASIILGSSQDVRKEAESRFRQSSSSNMPLVPQPVFFSRLLLKRQLQSHFGRVYALDWSPESYILASVSADAKMIVWDTIRAQKLNYIPLADGTVMSLAFEKSPNAKIVALGCFDFKCCIYDISDQFTAFPKRELMGHQGYVSCCGFVDAFSILTASGDKTCRLWDIEHGKTVLQFCGHEQDVMSLAVNPTNQNVFVSGSIDMTCKLWDIRVNRSYIGNTDNRKLESALPTYTIQGHRNDVNCVKFFPDGNSIISGSEDFTVRWFDLRSMTKINKFGDRRILAPVSSISTSLSGRLIMAGYNDGLIRVWDALSHEEPYPVRSSSIGGGKNDTSDSMFSRTSTLNNQALTNIMSPPHTNPNAGGLKYSTISSSDDLSPPGGKSSISRSKSGNASTAMTYMNDKQPTQNHMRTSTLTNVNNDAQAMAPAKYHLLGDDGRAHDASVSALAMTSFGDALASGSWDSNIKIWV